MIKRQRGILSENGTLGMMMSIMVMRNLSDSGSDSVIPVFAVWKLIKGAQRAWNFDQDWIEICSSHCSWILVDHTQCNTHHLLFMRWNIVLEFVFSDVVELDPLVKPLKEYDKRQKCPIFKATEEISGIYSIFSTSKPQKTFAKEFMKCDSYRRSFVALLKWTFLGQNDDFV